MKKIKTYTFKQYVERFETKEHAAAHLDISLQAIYNYLNGKRKPEKHIRRHLETFGIRFDV